MRGGGRDDSSRNDPNSSEKHALAPYILGGYMIISTQPRCASL